MKAITFCATFAVGLALSATATLPATLLCPALGVAAALVLVPLVALVAYFDADF